MDKYESALECSNCVLGLNCKTCTKKMVLQEAVKKAQALDRALELLNQKRDTALLDLERIVDSKKLFINIYFKDMIYKEHEIKNMEKDIAALKNQINTYTDCITTISVELVRESK